MPQSSRSASSSAPICLASRSTSGRIRRRRRTRQRQYPDQPAVAPWTGNFWISTIANSSCSTSRRGDFAEEYPGIAERLGGLITRSHGPDDRGPAGRRGIPRRARSAQAQARISRSSPATCSSNSFRTTSRRRRRRCWSRSCRPSADPALRDGKTHRARRLSRRHLSRARPQHRLPLSPVPRHHAVAVRCHRRRILLRRRRRCRRSGFRSGATSIAGHAAVADPPHRGAHRGRAAGRGGAETSRKPGSPAAARPNCRSICRQRGRRDRALRAVLRRLHRRLLPLSRRFRRSGGRPGAAGLHAADWLRRRRGAASERQPDLPRLRSAARIFHVSAQVPRLQADRACAA